MVVFNCINIIHSVPLMSFNQLTYSLAYCEERNKMVKYSQRVFGSIVMVSSEAIQCCFCWQWCCWIHLSHIHCKTTSASQTRFWCLRISHAEAIDNTPLDKIVTFCLLLVWEKIIIVIRLLAGFVLIPEAHVQWPGVQGLRVTHCVKIKSDLVTPDSEDTDRAMYVSDSDVSRRHCGGFQMDLLDSEDSLEELWTCEFENVAEGDVLVDCCMELTQPRWTVHCVRTD